MSKTIEKPAHYYNAPRREMLKFIPPNITKVLEIGCGEGSFGAELKLEGAKTGRNIEVVGVEIETDRAKKARTVLDKVIEANLDTDELPLPMNYFDCIVCNDVLEHLVSPWNLLKKLQNHITPDGCIIASIPNVQHWGVIKELVFQGKFTYADEGVLDITHLRFYTRSSIRQMFEDCRFEICNLVGINSRVRGWKFDILELLTNRKFTDFQYLQFAVVAKPNQVRKVVPK